MRRVVDELPTLRAPRATKREAGEPVCPPVQLELPPPASGDRASEVPEDARSLGRYRLLFKLASGGMGSVYAAVGRGPEGVDRTFAIKLINRARTGPSAERGRAELDAFIREARLTARIAHPNVLETFELGVERGEPFIVMPLVRGVSLAELMEASSEAGEPLRVELAIWIAMQVAAGLHAAHELAGTDGVALRLVHRDVSPQNVLLGFDGSVKLLDFGVAKLFESGRETTEGVVKGKFGYMSPEQVLGEPIDRRSDVFALGVVLYELLTGSALYSNLAPGVAALRTATEPPPHLPQHLAHERALDAVLQRALAKAPAERFASAEEMLEALRAILRDKPQTLDPSELVEVLARRFSHKQVELEQRLREATQRLASSPPEPPSSIQLGASGSAAPPASTTAVEEAGARTAPGWAGAGRRTTSTGHRPRRWVAVAAATVVGLGASLLVLAQLGGTREPTPFAPSDEAPRSSAPSSAATSPPEGTASATAVASLAPRPLPSAPAPAQTGSSAAASSAELAGSFVRKTAGISTAAKSVVIVTTATAPSSKPSAAPASASPSVRGQPFRDW